MMAPFARSSETSVESAGGASMAKATSLPPAERMSLASYQFFTEKVMQYAVGRHVDYRDMPAVRRIVRDAKTNNYTFESIVFGVVNSDAFRRREQAAAAPVVTRTAQVAGNTPADSSPALVSTAP